MTKLVSPSGALDDDILHEAKRLRLLAAVLELQHYTSTESNIVPIPGGDRVIAIGTPAQVAMLLRAHVPDVRPIIGQGDGAALADALGQWMTQSVVHDAPTNGAQGMNAAYEENRQLLKPCLRQIWDPRGCLRCGEGPCHYDVFMRRVAAPASRTNDADQADSEGGHHD
jgi:hypothetical protein